MAAGVRRGRTVPTSTRSLEATSLATDNVFSDGYSLQLGSVTGTVADGMTVTLKVPV